MCFSATASFITGSALSATGAVTIRKAERKAEIPLAMIPLLFGIQQIIEGLIWLSFRFNNLLLNGAATYVYSLFAYVVWPVFIPFSILLLEPVSWRRKLLLFFQFVGITVGAYLLYVHIGNPVVSRISDKSIAYVASHFYTYWVIALYFLATGVSALFSSHRIINIFGMLIFFSAGATYQFSTVSFVSVWCFFAAILSGVIVLYFIRKNLPAKQPFKK